MSTSPVAAPPRSDRGEAAAQLVIVIPVVIMILMLGVQAAVWFHAAHVATAAASRGAAAGSARHGTVGDAVSAASSMADDLHADLIREPDASVTSEQVRVTVIVQVPRVAPFFPRRVSRTAVEPRERFRDESER